MTTPIRSSPPLLERLRSVSSRRMAALVAALIVEGLLLLALLGLTPSFLRRSDPKSLSVFTIAPDASPPRPSEASQPSQRQPTPRAPEPPSPPPVPADAADVPQPVAPTPQPQPVAPAAPPTDPAPTAAPRPVYGPPAPGPNPNDTPVVGTAPDGQPLYAAAWYREPYDDELRGYLSTAQGPGYALIACRTVADYRVEDCVGLEEYPKGSNMLRAVLAAAWQFKVRPPRRGSRLLFGSWVRIRIDYLERPDRPGTMAR